MKAERANRSSPAHLSIVGSSRHLEPDIEAWGTYMAKDGGVLAHYHDPKNWPGPGVMYGTTKLMITYAANELAEWAKGKDGRYVMSCRCPSLSLLLPQAFGKRKQNPPFFFRYI
jgi:hypothetical protein